MELSERFLNLVQQQLASFEAEAEIKHLVVYIARSTDGQAPTLEAVGQWPSTSKALPPVESDLKLRAPSPDRRWYPLQEGSLLLGVLRAELFPSERVWPESLDQRLRAAASALAQCLGLELERKRLLDELNEQREQTSLLIHQLRNPLAALRTYAKLLLRKLGPESIHLNLVEGLLSEQDQLNRYISALDKLGQTQLPSHSGTSAPLLLPPVLSANKNLTVRSLLEPLIDRAIAMANLQGRKWFGPSKWPTWTKQSIPSADGAIPEIVANLLENAFRYSSPTSSIGMHITNEAICVWDEGLPIAYQDRKKLFEKGFRGKNSLECSIGSGLGLALGLELAEGLGGGLQLITPPNVFDSCLPNQGNAFVLKVPAKLWLEEED